MTLDLKEILQKYRPESFHDKLNQRLLGTPFDSYGMSKNTRYSPLNLMDVGFLGSLGAAPTFDLTKLKAYYKFNEVSGNLNNKATDVGSSDSLGTAADGVANGTLIYGQTGVIGDSINFDGSTGYFALGGTSIWNFTQGAGTTWSINLWYKKDVTGQTFRLFSQNRGSGPNSGQRGVTMGISSATSLSCFISTSNTDFYINGTVASFATDDTDFHMLTITYDEDAGSNEFKTYFDGVAKGTLTGTTTNAAQTPDNNPDMATIVTAVSEFFDGNLDEYSIWGRVLTPTEITSLYNSGSGLAL